MHHFKLKHKRLDLSKPHVMGILNITEDSFSDGGIFLDFDAARKQAEQMISDGADIIDVGGESSRPGAEPVSEQQELDRVMPMIEWLADDVDVSIDTTKPQLMLEAGRLGAALINDVCALTQEGALKAAAQTELPVCLMHMQGNPRTMQIKPHYDDVVAEINDFFKQRLSLCKKAGIAKDKILLDPGFGFGKTAGHNVKLLRQLGDLLALGCPILAGLSRKSLIAEVIDKPAQQRQAASVALAILAWQNGASILRVHDVAETVDALKMVEFIRDYQGDAE